jgi:hypothetical protein
MTILSLQSAYALRATARQNFLSSQSELRKFRKDGRVAEGARLESVYRVKPIEGSNPSLSAIRLRFATARLSCYTTYFLHFLRNFHVPPTPIRKLSLRLCPNFRGSAFLPLSAQRFLSSARWLTAKLRRCNSCGFDDFNLASTASKPNIATQTRQFFVVDNLSVDGIWIAVAIRILRQMSFGLG